MNIVCECGIRKNTFKYRENTNKEKLSKEFILLEKIKEDLEQLVKFSDDLGIYELEVLEELICEIEGNSLS